MALSNSDGVTQRPELTRVRDLDGDGKADDFEVITDDFGMSATTMNSTSLPLRTNKEIISLLWERDPRVMECARSHGEHLMKGEDRVGCIRPHPIAVAL